MILTCPECATRYFVDEAAVGGGRTVRCTSCGHAWKPEAPLDLSTPAEAAASPPPADARPLRGEDLPKVYRARVEERRRVREAAATGAVWAGAAAALALVAAAIVIFRSDVVRLWPKSASAYAAAGLPVNRVGLTIEQVQAQPALQDGRTALVVSGVLRNIRSESVAPPPLQVAVLDKDGKVLKRSLGTTGDALVPSGATRPFNMVVVEPPAEAAEVEVLFSLDSSPRRTRVLKTEASRSPPPLRRASRPDAPAPAPVEATPLAADDPLAANTAAGPRGEP